MLVEDLRPAPVGPAAERSRDTAPELSGDLASIGVVPLIRFLARLGKTGDLRVACDGWHATICFEHGRLIAAFAGDEAGWPALELVLLCMSTGDFQFTAGRPSLAANLDAPDDNEAARHGWIRTLKGLVQPQRPAARRIRPERRARLVLAGCATGLTALLALVWLIGTVASGVMFVKGSSMTPLLHAGQLLVLNRGAYGTPDRPGPQRGDVVIFRRGAAGDNGYLVKRVIGLPGDLVRVDTGRVFVNGTPLDEPYVLASDDYTYPVYGGPLRVPDGEYFVLGDNRPVSADSHLGWFVPAGDMLGQALPLPVVIPSLPMPASA